MVIRQQILLQMPLRWMVGVKYLHPKVRLNLRLLAIMRIAKSNTMKHLLLVVHIVWLFRVVLTDCCDERGFGLAFSFP